MILVAGGSGTRMKMPIPKQFLLLNEIPIFIYALNTFLETFPDGKIVMVTHPDFISDTNNIIEQYLPNQKIEIVEGGTTRFHSVKNGLDKVDTEYVMIHDAVRPFITKEFLENLLKVCMSHSNAIPAKNISESVRIIEEDGNSIVDRSKLKLIQTPQTFKTEILKAAFLQPFQESFTDDASVMETFGEKINLVEGLPFNIKITEPIDLEMAGVLIKYIK